MSIQDKTIGSISGDMYKHFRKSMVPFVTSEVQTADVLPHCLEHKTLYGILQNTQRRCYTAFSKSKPYKNAETQTDYRESEAQTEPWEPPCKIVPGHNPEVLTLAHLTWEHGLPAGVHEIHIINRMRIKRAWEAILPPIDTPANIKMRNSIITALEIDEWAFRESEIQFIMDLRLDLMRNLLQSHESKYEKKVQSRFSRLRSKLSKYRDNQIKAIRYNLKRDLRKLHKKHRNEHQSRKPDIIERHIDLKSDLYAPQMRFGEHPQRWHEILPKQLSREYHIEQEEEDAILSWLPTIEEPKVIKHKPKSIDICIRETRWTEEKLKQLHSDLKAIRMKVKSVDEGPRLVKRHEQLVLPTTPRRSGTWDNKQKQREESAIFIQKLVKGRAIQCLMYQGRNRCRELIEELQSTQVLEHEDYDEKIHMINLRQLQKHQSMQENRLCEILDSLEGKTICGILDFLSKELIRLEDERRAHAFALLAERERCMREAAEAGRRQAERNRRREFDEMFKQIIKVNQDSVEAYLEDIVREEIDWISDKAAKEHVSEICDKVDAVTKHAAENATKLADEELIADMIYNFVLPEVEKHNMRKKIRDQQQSYMRNAYISLYEKILELPSIEPLQVVNQEVPEQDIEAEEIELPISKTEDKKRADLEIDSQSDLMEAQ
ncbi:AMY-1-associating protein expressed in testis 1 [Atta colombica]|uniref:Cilia- and flagella-associated protein 91 n=1 Tax=Atta colombica TaxID=520822 RepID=A0A195AVT5_9HYME|nr:AMY-1-associating protein expressed in testis 1 [Atta colombica]